MTSTNTLPEPDALPAPQHWKPVARALQDLRDATPGHPVQVVILGAGMAGLCAAVELAGHPAVEKIDIYEATEDRVGGRVWTHRVPGSDQYGEFGAMRIPLSHDYTLHYLRTTPDPDGDEPHLRIRPFFNSSGQGDLFEATDRRGTVHRFTRADLATHAFVTRVFGRLTDAEFARLRGEGGRRNDPANILDDAMQPLMDTLLAHPPMARALVAGDFAGGEPWRDTLRRWDGMSLEDYLRATTSIRPPPPPSEAAIRLLSATLSLTNTWGWSLAAHLRASLTNAPLSPPSPWRGLWEIVGGFDRLPRGMLSRLQGSGKVTIHFAHELRALERTGATGTVTLHDRRRDTTVQRTIDARVRLLSTIPFPVLRDPGIRLAGLSPEKLRCIHGFRYARATKVLLWSKPMPGGVPFWHLLSPPITFGRSVSDRTREAGGAPAALLQTYYPAPAEAGREPPPPAPLHSPPSAGAGRLAYWSVDTHADAEPPPVLAAAPHPTRLDLLASYSFEDNAEAIGALEPAARVRFCVDLLTRKLRLPDLPVDHHASMAWDRYEWARGAFGMTPPGDLSGLYTAGRRSEGHFHFAGEQISIAPGWIQGAFESALAAALALLQPTSSDACGA
jgi:monoamine oxidase